MRVFPSTVHAFRSAAERKVFDLLLATDFGPDAFALHSLNLSKHEYKRWAEIDFVIAWDEGVFALEVKGGRVACTDGVWTFTNRFGEQHHKSEGPFDQAKSGHDALRSFLDGRQEHLDLRSLCWGWGVVFPDIEFAISSPAWAKELVCDHAHLTGRRDLSQYLRRLATWWRSQGRGHRSLASPKDLEALRQALRPDFDRVPSLAASIDHAVDSAVRLTEEQLAILDSIDDNDRILCTGGAGTGKSFLAVEAARREAAAGRQPLLLCRSPLFAAFLRARVNDNRVSVADWAAVQQFLDRDASFDVVIIDEAQDLLSSACIEAVGKLVRGGVERGRWRLFLDPNNQSGLFGTVEPDVLARLRGVATNHKLRRNCRNTQQIVLQTQLITGADIGVAVIEGQGPPIEIVDVPDTKSSAEVLEQRIIDWLDQGVRPGHITVLSPRSFGQSAARFLSRKLAAQMVQLNASNAAHWPLTSLSFSTIRDFKGLENRCIAIADLDQFSGSHTDTAELYVAMTRAHAGLWIAIPSTLRPGFNRLVSEHAKRLLHQGATP